MDEHIDLRNHRRRLAHLAIGVTAGLLTTTLVMIGILQIASAPGTNPLSQASVVLMAIGMVVVTSGCFATLCATIDRHLLRKARTRS